MYNRYIYNIYNTYDEGQISHSDAQVQAGDDNGS